MRWFIGMGMLLMATVALVGAVSAKFGLGLATLMVAGSLLGAAWVATAVYLISEPRR